MKEKHQRMITITLYSFLINLGLGLLKFFLGWYVASIWFMSNALYYLLLSVARGSALRKLIQVRQLKQLEERKTLELATYRRCGLFLCLIGLSYFVVCVRMYAYEDASQYTDGSVYLIALIAFTKLGMAVYGWIATRHMEEPILCALKKISFIDAMVSIVVTQCAITTMVHSPHPAQHSAILGTIVGVLSFLLGIWMMKKKRHRGECEYRVEETIE